MKRNVLIVLALALVCVLFVACGKKETPVEVAIDELQAARENIDSQIAALEAQRPATKGGSGTAVNVAVVGQPTPVEKTREEMTEEEKEAYDKAKIAEFAERLDNTEFARKKDRGEAIWDAIISCEVYNMGVAYDYDADREMFPVYIPYYKLSDECLVEWARTTSSAASLLSAHVECYHGREDELGEYFSKHPECVVPILNLFYEKVDGVMGAGVGMDDCGDFLKIIPVE